MIYLLAFGRFRQSFNSDARFQNSRMACFLYTAFWRRKTHFMKAHVSENTDTPKAFRRMNIFHWFMLTLSGIAIIFEIEL